MKQKINVTYKVTEKYTPERIDKILKIQSQKGLTPENLINEAKDKNNPLHDLFDWDNNIAGDKWRLQQARVIINEVKVVIDEKEYYAFENVSVKVNDNLEHKREYMPIVTIMSNKELRQQIIRSALQQLAYWEKQNEKYTELMPIIQTAQKVRKEIEKQWQKKKK